MQYSCRYIYIDSYINTVGNIYIYIDIDIDIDTVNLRI